jgi:6-carboxyhexanoate--CoA ligase
MDGDVPAAKETKNHFREALILATKAAHAPCVVGEICLSDDPDYVTGYVASKKLGYIRFTKLKKTGDPGGGRILLYRGGDEDLAECIRYLQKQPVLVTDIPECPAAGEQKWAELKRVLDEKKARRLYRRVPEMESAQSSHIRYQNRDMLLFASNNYLDLAADRRVTESAAEATKKYGAGAGGSRLTTGSTPPHSRLEKMLAEWKGTEAALLFNTGYMANLGTISALCSKDWVIFSDEKNHASIIDGCRLSGAKIVVYKHNDMDDLNTRVRPYRGRRGLIVSDSVFSMDGDIVNLPGLMETAERCGMYSMIDEAHATGVVGESGRGVTELFHLKPDIIAGTCSKALGSEGGFVCGNAELIDFLINQARSFIFSTALPPGVAAASARALEIIREEPWRVLNLRNNVRFFCSRLGEYGVEVSSQTAIVPIIIGDEEKAVAVSDKLNAEGFYIPAIRYPTVPAGQAMLRAALMSSHTEAEIDAAARAIGRAISRA